jgi:hypothetical protein
MMGAVQNFFAVFSSGVIVRATFLGILVFFGRAFTLLPSGVLRPFLGRMVYLSICRAASLCNRQRSRIRQ